MIEPLRLQELLETVKESMDSVLYFECNESTWANLLVMLPPHIGKPEFFCDGIEIRVVPGSENGFHPVREVRKRKINIDR